MPSPSRFDTSPSSPVFVTLASPLSIMKKELPSLPSSMMTSPELKLMGSSASAMVMRSSSLSVERISTPPTNSSYCRLRLMVASDDALGARSTPSTKGSDAVTVAARGASYKEGRVSEGIAGADGAGLYDTKMSAAADAERFEAIALRALHDDVLAGRELHVFKCSNDDVAVFVLQRLHENVLADDFRKCSTAEASVLGYTGRTPVRRDLERGSHHGVSTSARHRDGLELDFLRLRRGRGGVN